MSFRVYISDRLANDPDVLGSPTAFDMFYDLDRNLENSTYIGSCIVYVCEALPDEESDFYERKGLARINSLHIREDFRKRGLGLDLLKYVMRYLYQSGVRYAELDDVSDYMGRPDCIYKKAGFNYVSDDNQMRANLRHCVMS